MNTFLKSGKLGSSNLKQGETSLKQVPKKVKRPLPWVEKYRPQTVEDIAEQTEVIAVLRECINGADFPNLLLYGPPGTGKTSTILAAARELFGDMYKSRVLELNASDERGIQVVRDKIKTFAQLSASSVRPDGKPCPNFKIIILDEADSMTHAAQSALRRTMEKESKSTRFCLLCNYVSRIIEPLTSRCTKFRFKPLNDAIIHEKLEAICKAEQLNCDEKVLDALIEESGGDMRRAITALQCCFRFCGKKPVTTNDVYEVLGRVPNKWITDMVQLCKTKNYNEIEEFVQDFISEGYSAMQFIVQFNDLLLKLDAMDDSKKARLFKYIGITCFKLEDGADEFIQMLNFAYLLAAES